jgi:hypothetical protein
MSQWIVMTYSMVVLLPHRTGMTFALVSFLQ